MTTTEGEMVLLLYNDTPKHRDNFVKLVKNGTYDGLLFHRVIRNFMIQGGDPKSRDAKPGQPLGDGTLGYTVPAEFRANHIHKKGALCAARQGDDVNPRKESSASQFYIVQGNVWDNKTLDMMEVRFGKKFTAEQRRVYTTVGGTPHLDGQYTVFGEVVSGLDAVDAIQHGPTDENDRPLTDVRIIKAYLQ
jgi:peptidyl-prolyl cis-trans isomerase B (cyclophilin B)